MYNIIIAQAAKSGGEESDDENAGQVPKPPVPTANGMPAPPVPSMQYMGPGMPPMPPPMGMAPMGMRPGMGPMGKLL